MYSEQDGEKDREYEFIIEFTVKFKRKAWYSLIKIWFFSVCEKEYEKFRKAWEGNKAVFTISDLKGKIHQFSRSDVREIDAIYVPHRQLSKESKGVEYPANEAATSVLADVATRAHIDQLVAHPPATNTIDVNETPVDTSRQGQQRNRILNVLPDDTPTGEVVGLEILRGSSTLPLFAQEKQRRGTKRLITELTSSENTLELEQEEDLYELSAVEEAELHQLDNSDEDW